MLARDTAQAESGFTTVKSEKDLQGLQGLLSQQQELEVRHGERGRPCPWWGSVLAGWGCPREALAPRGPGVVSLGTPRRPGLEFSSQAELCPTPLPSASTGQARGESLHQFPCAIVQLPAPYSSSRRWGGDSQKQSGETRQPSALPILPTKGGSAHSLQPLCQHPPFHPSLRPCIPKRRGVHPWAKSGWMHPEPFLPCDL